MTATSYWWGSNATPFTVNPDLEGGIDITPVEYGSAIRTANLTLRQDTLGTKRRITLRFTVLTLTQLEALQTQYNTRRAADAEAGAYVALENETTRKFTVKPALDGFKQLPTTDGGATGAHYGCTITLDEV